MTNEHEEMLGQVDEALRRLKIQYDLFFAGIRKLPPTEDRKRVDAAMRELGSQRMRDNATRFRFSTIISKYNQFQELWNRQMREREEGPMDFKGRMAAMATAEQKLAAKGDEEPLTGKPASARVTSGEGDASVRVSGSSNGDSIQELHGLIMDAQKKLGKSAALSLEQVTSMVQKQIESLRERYGVKTVAFRVETVDGKVKLKAKPIQE